jgi:sugar (pentulose or hexulose) kinase
MDFRKILYFDITDSLCRAVLCTYNTVENSCEFKEIYRFRSYPAMISGHKYRDLPALVSNIKKSISKTLKELNGEPESIGISATAMEYGLLDKYGYIMHNPFSYEDIRTENITDKVLRFIKRNDLFSITGYDICRFSPMVQLMSENDVRPYILENASVFLMLPDLIKYILTGDKSAEYTSAFSSQLINCEKYDWSGKIISMLRFKRNIFPDIVYENYSALSDSICEELKCNPINVKVSGSYLSGCSVILEKYDSSLIIDSSNDTKICICTDKPVISRGAYEAGISNAGVYNKKFLVFCHENGINIIDRTIKCFTERNISCNYSKLENTAVSSEPLRCFVNTDDEIFCQDKNIPIAVQDYCRNTGQYVPRNVSEMIRCLYESIAFKYASSAEKLSRISEKNFSRICMTGRDSGNEIICRTLANIFDTEVISGIENASVYGNIALHLADKNTDTEKILDAFMPDGKFKIYTPDENREKTLSEYKKMRVHF